MRRGTRVGNAYVALAVDASNMDRDIANAVEDGFDGVDATAMGDKHGGEYARGLKEHLSSLEDHFDQISRRMEGNLTSRLNRAIDTSEGFEVHAKKMFEDAFGDGALDSLFEHIGREAGVSFEGGFGAALADNIRTNLVRSIEDSLRSGDHNFSGIFRTMSTEFGDIDMLGPAVDRAIADARRLGQTLRGEQEALGQSLADDWLENQERMYAGLFDLIEDRESAERTSIERIRKDTERMYSDLFDRIEDREFAERTSMERTRKDMERIYADMFDRIFAEEEALEMVRSLEAEATAAAERLRAKQEKDGAALSDAWRRDQEALYLDLFKQIDTATTKTLRAQDEINKAHYKRIMETDKALRKQAEAEKEAAQAARKAAAARRADDSRYSQFLSRARKMMEGIRFDPKIDKGQIEGKIQELQKYLESRDDLELSLEADLPLRERAKIEAQIRAINAKIKVSVDEDHLNRTLLGQRTAAQKDTDISVLVGRFFGKGSRMDGIHYIGSMLSMATKGLQGLVGLGPKFFNTFSRGFSAVNPQASGLTKTFGGLQAVGGSLGATLSKAVGPQALALIPIFAGLFVVVSGLVSAVVALGSLLGTVLATAIAGVTGAAVALGGALAAAAAGAGLLTLAFTSMTDAQKKALGETFRPVKEIFTGLGQTILQDLLPATAAWSQRLQVLGAMLQPLAQAMGSAFADAGNYIAAALTGPGFQKLIYAFQTFLPNITRNFGVAVNGVLGGISGTLAALMPVINRVMAYLASVAQRWNAWVNKPESQNAIVNFAEKAMEALRSFWAVIRETGGLIKDFFFSDQSLGSGVSIFDTLAGKIASVRKTVQEMADDGRLAEWFDTAMRFGAGLWATIHGIGSVIASLTNSGILDAMANGFRGLGIVLDWIGDIGPDVIAGLSIGVLEFVELIGAAIDSLVGLAKSAVAVMNNMLIAYNAIPMLDNVSLIGGGNIDVFGAFKGAYNNGIRAWADNAEKSLRNWAQGTSRSKAPAEAGRTAAQSFTNAFNSNVSFDSLLKGLGNSMKSLGGSGRSALAQTSVGSGGTATEADYVNPYVDWANRLIASQPSTAALLRDAVRQIHASAVEAVREASVAVGAGRVQEILAGATDAMYESAKAEVEQARQALSNAAQSLANASSAEAAREALADVKTAQKDLQRAQKAQQRVEKGMRKLYRHQSTTSRSDKFLSILSDTTEKNINSQWSRLTTVLKKSNITLADYAAMREALAERLTAAQASLDSALALRDNFQQSVVDSVKTFGSLLSAEAKTIDGVAQALTADDITSNLRDRLGEIRKFQMDLRTLQAMGVNDSVYKQLVEAGVEQGGQFAAALIAGGSGAVREANNLAAEIDSIAESLGVETSRVMYQAGVDAAQGLVNGLTSLSGRLETGAAKLGDAIAAALKKSLGIKSPSRVMIEAMRFVGDGIEQGLDEQHVKVEAAASRLSSKISPSPEVASYEAQQRAAAAAAAAGVSGNGPEGFRDLHVHTPTKDPVAVAAEVLNEMTERL